MSLLHDDEAEVCDPATVFLSKDSNDWVVWRYLYDTFGYFSTLRKHCHLMTVLLLESKLASILTMVLRVDLGDLLVGNFVSLEFSGITVVAIKEGTLDTVLENKLDGGQIIL